MEYIFIFVIAGGIFFISRFLLESRRFDQQAIVIASAVERIYARYVELTPSKREPYLLYDSYIMGFINFCVTQSLFEIGLSEKTIRSMSLRDLVFQKMSWPVEFNSNDKLRQLNQEMGFLSLKKDERFFLGMRHARNVFFLQKMGSREEMIVEDDIKSFFEYRRGSSVPSPHELSRELMEFYFASSASH